MAPQKAHKEPPVLPIEVVHRLAGRLLPGSRVSIWQVTERQLTLLTGAGHSAEDASLINSVLETGAAITTISSGSGEWTHIIPLTLQDELAGLLVVTYPLPERGEKADLELLDLLSDYARSILSHFRLLRQITRAKLEWERTFDALGDPLLLVTPDYTVMRANSGAAAVNRLTPREFVGQRCHEIFRGLPSPCPGCPLPRLMETKEPAFLELENVLGDRVHHAYFYPLINEGGQVEAVVEHVLDVTHQMRTRASLIQVQKAHALSMMVSGIAHNFSNYLETILGQAESLREHIADPSALLELEALQQAALDAAELIRRLREFSRKGRPSTRWAPIDMNHLVKDVLGLLSLKDRQPRVELSLELGKIPGVQGNELELKEVLLNLLFNALDAMPFGGSLGITTRTVEEGLHAQRAVEVRVTDTGLGMSEEVRLRAFDPFYTTKEGHGTGLGLSVSYGAVRRHGGTIECESQPGRGSSFIILLPAITALTDAVPEAPPIRPRALVVDDNESVVASLVEILSSLGCDVTAAGTGHEALSLFSPGAYDVVFTDLAMPDLSGMQVAKAIRELDRTVPILLVSAWSKYNLQEQLNAYRVTFIEKPFSLSRIQSIVSEAVSLRSLREEPRARR
jgi:signal transduction histidine kinase/CheY-like chemotaxis protein